MGRLLSSPFVGAALVALFACITCVPSVVATANPQYYTQLMTPAGYSTDETVQFACSIAVAHSGVGAAIGSRIPDTNQTIITVYDSNLTWLVTLLGPTMDAVTANATGISCKVAISDNLKTVAFSIAGATIALANPGKVYVYDGDPVTANYTLTQSWVGNATTLLRSIAMDSTGQLLVMSSQATVYANNFIQVLYRNTTNSTLFTVYQTLTPPVSEGGQTKWTEDIALSTDGTAMIANAPALGHIYAYTNGGDPRNYTYVGLLSYNTTSTAFGGIALSGDGKRAFATYNFQITQADNVTINTYNGALVWTYNDSAAVWGANPVSINFATSVLNTTSNITTVTYTYKISKIISACKQGKGFMVPLYVNATTGNKETVLFAEFEEDSNGIWTATSFPEPPANTWLLPAIPELQQITPTSGSGIGFSNMMSDAGDLAIVPTQQSTITGFFVYWASAYTTVTDCGVPEAPIAAPVITPQTAGMAIGVAIAGAILLTGIILVAVVPMKL